MILYFCFLLIFSIAVIKRFRLLSGKDRTEKRFVGIAYLRLSADDATTVYDGLHELFLHQVSFFVVFL